MAILGVGVDLVACERVQRLLEDHGQHARDRLFTPAEQAYCQSARRAMEHFAARFAAKEAILKALGTGWRGGIAWTDMQVLPDAAGKPVLTLSNHTADLAAGKGIRAWQVSLTHTAEFAAAIAVAEG